MCSEADFSAPDQLCTGSTHSSLEPFRGRFSGPGAISPREAGIRIRADQPCPMGWPASAASDASARAPSALARLISSRAAHRCAAVVAQARRDPGCATPRSTPSPSWCHSGAHRAAGVCVSRVRPCSHGACWAGCAGADGSWKRGARESGGPQPAPAPVEGPSAASYAHPSHSRRGRKIGLRGVVNGPGARSQKSPNYFGGLPAIRV
jgi:hypothetical protein